MRSILWQVWGSLRRATAKPLASPTREPKARESLSKLAMEANFGEGACLRVDDGEDWLSDLVGNG